MTPAPAQPVRLQIDPLADALDGCAARAALFADDAFTDPLRQALDRALAGPGAVLSLDVFDTLIWRDDSAEITRFVEFGAAMAQVLADDGTVRAPSGALVSADQAFIARDLAMRAAYRHAAARRRDGRLRDIHRAASRVLSGSARFADAFVKAELTAELPRLTLNRWLWDYAQAHRARGGRVVLASDMYLTSDQIAQLLNGLGARDGWDVLLSSADGGGAKATGAMFDTLADRMGGWDSPPLHLGDDVTGDLVQPLRRGWQARLLPVPVALRRARAADHDATVARLADRLGWVPPIARPD